MQENDAKLTWLEPCRLRWALYDPGILGVLFITVRRFATTFALFMAMGYAHDYFKGPSALVMKLQIAVGIAALLSVGTAGYTALLASDVSVSRNGVERSRSIWYGYRFETWPWGALSSVSIEERLAGRRSFQVLVLKSCKGTVHQIAIEPKHEDRVRRFLANIGITCEVPTGQA